MNRSNSNSSPRRIARGLFALATTGALVVGLGVGCTHDNPSSITVPLTYKPKDNLNTAALASQVLDAKIFIAPVMDDRPAAQRDKIGENTEDSDAPPIPVIADSDVGAFVHQLLIDQLKGAGLTVVQSPEEADRVLQASLTQFWVHETGSYESTVSATFSVTTKSNAKVWGPGKFTAAAHNWGRSKNANNYQETYSESAQQLIEQLLSNPGFRTSLSKAAAPAAIVPDAPKATKPKENPLTKKPALPAEPTVTETPEPKVEKPAVPAVEEPKVEIKAPPAREAAEEAKDSATEAKEAAKEANDAASQAKDAADDAKDANK